MDKVISLFFVFFSLHYSAQTVDFSSLDSLFNTIEKKKEGMGHISIFEEGREVYQHAFGYSDLKNKKHLTPQNRYRIASVTKSFVAVIILQLVQEGKLQLSSPLSDFFPEIPGAKKIQIEQLLRHRSGLTDRNYLNWKYHQVPYRLKKKATYANTNYVLLAQIAEKIEQRNFADLLAERIIKPCQLSATSYGYQNISDKTDEVTSYRWKNGWQFVSPSNLSKPHGAGGIISTAEDVNRFFHCLFNGSLLAPDMLKEMTRTVDGYGMGIMRNYYKTTVSYGHSGQIDGFQSTVVYFPEMKLSLTITTNALRISMNDILANALILYFTTLEKR